MPRPGNQPNLSIRLTLVTVLLTFAVLLSGCGKSAGDNAIHVKSATTGEKDLAIKTGYAFPVTKTFTDVNGKMTAASAYNVYLANYDLDAKSFSMTLDKPLTADDQVRVVFSLIGDEGT